MLKISIFAQYVYFLKINVEIESKVSFKPTSTTTLCRIKVMFLINTPLIEELLKTTFLSSDKCNQI